jgi:peptide/nickel transport system ATP-binding protein
MSLLEIRDLKITFHTDLGVVSAVNGVDISIDEGETLGLVGETGAGKTTTALAVMGLVATPPGKIESGEILYKGEDLLRLKQSGLRGLRGAEIAMIFQDPMTSLNPVMTVGEQIADMIAVHERCAKAEAQRRMLAMLEKVSIPYERAEEYPHSFSGGMKQRVIIAMALALNPKLIIADEPTTALDVTIQAQVLDMMNDLRHEFGTSMLLITHDFGVVAETCDKAAVMYAGEIVESGRLEDIFEHTAHPYTKGLFGSIPRLDKKTEKLSPIDGDMPDPTNLPKGCKFHPRCPVADERCRTELPPATEVSPGHVVRCLKAGRIHA